MSSKYDTTIRQRDDERLEDIPQPKRIRGKRFEEVILQPLSTEDEKILQTLDRSLVQSVVQLEQQKELDILNRVAEHREMKMKTTRLPTMAQTIRSIMMGYKSRTVIPLCTLMTQLHYALEHIIPKKDMEASLRLLVQLLPEWAKIFSLADIEYFQLLKTEFAFQKILSILNIRISDYHNHQL